MNKSLFFSLAVAMCMVACKSGEAQVEAPVQVNAIVLKDTTIIVGNEFPATMCGIRDVAIYPQVSGRIVATRVTPGSYVNVGDVLFEIDDVPYKAQYESAKAQLEVSKAQLETAKLTLKSKENLYQKNIISEYQYKLAQNEVKTAQAIVGQSKAALKIAENNLSFTKVRTMGKGYVGSLPFAVGSLVGPQMDKPLTMVSDNSSVYADFSISENVYLQIMENYDSLKGKDAIPVKLITNLGVQYNKEGVIHSVSGLISKETGSIPVKAKFENTNDLLLSGGACKVVLSTERNGVTIPRASIKELQDKLFVFVIKDGELVQTEIQAERINNTLWGLLPGEDGEYAVKPGDKITATTNRLVNGAAVQIIEK